MLDPDNSGLNVGNAILSNSIYGNAAHSGSIWVATA